MPRRARTACYRLQELKRFSQFLDLPLTPQPAHFPPSSMLGGLVVAAARRQGTALAMQVLETVLEYDMAQEQDSVMHQRFLRR